MYHCVGGSHSSTTAAAIHLGLLPMEYIPDRHDFLGVPFYDTLEKCDRGKIILRGIDEKGHKIYTLSRQFSPHLVIPAIQDMWRVLEQQEDDLMIVNTLPTVNTLMKIGGFSSRRLQWVRFGRPIVIKGTQSTYMNIVKVVRQIKEKII
ncbi:DUF3189 family protein [Anaerosolibacter carboniphilus]